MGTGWTASDWNHYWMTNEPSREVVDAQRKWVLRIQRFAEKEGRSFHSMADFGCGPAIALFELAGLFPDASFRGFEASTALVARNRRKAADLGIRNVSFETTEFPHISGRQTFDLILCIATLHYVERSLLALRNLFSLVTPGGNLIFNYPNVFTMHWYRTNLEEADESLRRRFDLVLEGRNLLSRRKIAEALGRPCCSFWREVGETGERANPCLFVSRPGESASLEQSEVGDCPS